MLAAAPSHRRRGGRLKRNLELAAFEHALACVFDVSSHRFAGGGLVPGGNGFEHHAMLVLAGQYAVARLNQRQIAVQRDADDDLRMQAGQGFSKETVSGRVRNGAVKGNVFFDAERSALLDDRVEDIERVADPAQPC